MKTVYVTFLYLVACLCAALIFLVWIPLNLIQLIVASAMGERREP